MRVTFVPLNSGIKFSVEKLQVEKLQVEHICSAGHKRIINLLLRIFPLIRKVVKRSKISGCIFRKRVLFYSRPRRVAHAILSFDFLGVLYYLD